MPAAAATKLRQLTYVPPAALQGDVVIVRLSLLCATAAGTGVTLAASNDYVFGIRSPPAPPPPPPGCDTEAGFDWHPDVAAPHVAAKDSAACCAACSSKPDCKVGVLFGTECFLKTAAQAQTKYARAGRTSCMPKHNRTAAGDSIKTPTAAIGMLVPSLLVAHCQLRDGPLARPLISCRQSFVALFGNYEFIAAANVGLAKTFDLYAESGRCNEIIETQDNSTVNATEPLSCQAMGLHTCTSDPLTSTSPSGDAVVQTHAPSPSQPGGPLRAMLDVGHTSLSLTVGGNDSAPLLHVVAANTTGAPSSQRHHVHHDHYFRQQQSEPWWIQF